MYVIKIFKEVWIIFFFLNYILEYVDYNNYFSIEVLFYLLDEW